MSSRKVQFSIGILCVLCGTLLLVAQTKVANAFSGQWMIEPCNDKAQTLQLTLRYNQRGENERYDGWGDWGSTQSHAVDLQDLSGLTEADLKSGGTNVKFKIMQDAGSLQNEGWFANGKGSGHFDYVPNPQFSAELKQRGFDAPTEDEQFKLTMSGFKLALLDELKKEGYGTFDVHTMVKMANHGVSVEYLHDLNAAGYKFDSVDRLIKLRDHGITKGYIDAMAAAGFKNLTPDELLKARDHGVGPDFIAGWKELGYTSADLPGLVKLRDHGVTPEFAKEMSALGFKNLEPSDLTRMRDHGVNAEFVREVREARPGENISPGELIRLKDHGVSASLIREHKDMSLDEVIRMRDRGGDY